MSKVALWGPQRWSEGFKCAVDLLNANKEMSASYYLDP